jgi:uncharacterized protein YbbC (DUF1343 family)/CubicO group peptidase (beta-lactamase class C family)
MRAPAALVVALAFCSIPPAPAALPEASPEQLGFDRSKLARVDAAIEMAIAEKKVPGAVVLVGRHGRIAWVKAYGLRAVEPSPEPMTRDTIFDMASLTKPIATATSAMILLERGRFHLDDALAQHLPDFDNHGKGAIRVEHLMRHRAGLIADNPLSDYGGTIDESWRHLANLDLKSPPGERFVYSDVGFMVLGRLVERLAGTDLNTFSRNAIFGPLGMTDTGFIPLGAVRENDKALHDRTAPTERANGTMLRAIVHDPRSRALGGVAGHAGLFSTADDLAVYAQMLLAGGTGPNGVRILKPETVQAMLDPGDTPPRQRRGLGWDIATSYSGPRGKRFGPRSFGHTGFTGTSIWIDPETDTFVILLTSRLHPDGKQPAPNRLRSEVATLVAEAIVEPPLPPPPAPAVSDVRCGIDVLIARDFAPLKNKRVGLVTNHTGLARDGRSTIDVLHKAPGVQLIALFSPEHGIRGAVDRPVADSKDEATGLPIYSLYGQTRKPTAESLRDVEILVYDIQDIGTRFYTYISTLGLLLESAKEHGIPLIVLDRPNPIGGTVIGGPVRDDGFESFIAHHAIPVRHGMTVGELARMFNAERGINADLTVIPCEGWDRADLFDRTGLLWVNPSPNMRSLTEALLYPGVGLLEGTNLATGRGTDTPFERVGAPFIDPVRFAAALNNLDLPGVRFVPIRFRPSERQFSGEDCGGVFIQITDRDRFDPIDLGLGLAAVLRAEYRDQWNPDALKRFLCDSATYDAILEGRSVSDLKSLYTEELASFARRRAPYLIYP